MILLGVGATEAVQPESRLIERTMKAGLFVNGSPQAVFDFSARPRLQPSQLSRDLNVEPLEPRVGSINSCRA